VARSSATRIDFAPVPLETLVDAPVLLGQNLRTVELGGPHQLHVAADSTEAVGFGDDVAARYRRLVSEANALFGAHHYRGYHFLLSLSEHVAHFGLEHHESSDNRQRERVFLDEALRVTGAGLLPHEYVHSWNGKFRRPAGLATPDYQTPMKGDLLWIYEGLTTYLGEVLTARSGLRSADQEREAIALTAASLDVAPGRTWRPLADTAVAAQILYGGPSEWRSWRRGVDFYPESELIWLEADALIRQQSGGQRSLDDFCRAFHGKTSGPPAVEPYTLDDVVAALNAVAAHDWRRFFAARIDGPTTRAPLGGLEAAGWRLVYRDAPSGFHKQVEQSSKTINLSWSLGLVLKDDGVVLDAIPGTPAGKAGVAPGAKIVAVNGRRFSGDVVRDAVKATKQRELELIVESGDYFRTYKVSYRGGARYPMLERIAGKADLLGEILRTHAP
jgi:predicted metalloprotease with PDZ domain